MLKNLPSSKSIPATIWKQSANNYLPLLTNSLNHSVHEKTFPNDIKVSEVIPLYKTRSVTQRGL